MKLPVGTVLCMPGQYWVFPPLGVVACLLQGVAAVLKGFLLLYPAKHGGAHQDFGAGCPYWWLHGPIHPKYAILQAASSWWRCPVKRNQRLPEHGEVWHYRLGSGSYPRNAAWQMILSCFAKCPCRAQRWGICLRARGAIGPHYEKLPWCVLNHHQLGPYKPGTFAGSAH